MIKLLSILLLSVLSFVITFARVVILMVSALILFLAAETGKLFQLLSRGTDKVKEISNNIIDIVM